MSPSLLHRWRDQAKEGAKAALGGKSVVGETEKDRRHSAARTDPRQEIAGDRNSKKRHRELSCGEVHSQARALVEQGYTATLVATALLISRTYDEQVVVAQRREADLKTIGGVCAPRSESC